MDFIPSGITIFQMQCHMNKKQTKNIKSTSVFSDTWNMNSHVPHKYILQCTIDRRNARMQVSKIEWKPLAEYIMEVQLICDVLGTGCMLKHIVSIWIWIFVITKRLNYVGYEDLLTRFNNDLIHDAWRATNFRKIIILRSTQVKCVPYTHSYSYIDTFPCVLCECVKFVLGCVSNPLDAVQVLNCRRLMECFPTIQHIHKDGAYNFPNFSIGKPHGGSIHLLINIDKSPIF